jgi:hypothetical protein
MVEEELHHKSFHPDFLEDYDGAKEEISDGSVFFDADHAHDHQTRHSITGIIVFVGSTPVLWPSKHQGCIASSTYTVEFVAMRSAVEEAILIRYMLRCLGTPVMKPTNLYGDNFGVIQSATIPEGELKKDMLLLLITMFVNQLQQDSSMQFGLNFTRISRMCMCIKALEDVAFNEIVCDLMA